MSIRLYTLLLFVPAYTLTTVAYVLVGEYTARGTTYTLATPLDDALPFVPGFAFGYLFLYVLPLVLIATMSSMHRLRLTVTAYAIVNVIAFPIYLLYPIYHEKPVVDSGTVAGWLLALEQSMDPPTNCLPSLHAGVAMMIFLCCRGIHRVLSGALLASALLIGVSAVLVKQHYIADIIAGFGLAWFAHAVSTKWIASRSAFVER